MKFRIIMYFTTLSLLLVACDSKDNSIKNAIVQEVKQAKVVAKKEESTKEKPKAEESESISFSLKTFDKKTIDIKIAKEKWTFGQYDGKIILLDFFGTWCPPCKKEIPHLNNLREHYNGKFEIIGLDIGNRDGSMNSDDQLKEFVKEYNIKFPITKGKVNNEMFSGLMNLNKAGSIPFMILFNQNGQFIKPYIGMVSEQQLQNDIDKLLK